MTNRLDHITTWQQGYFINKRQYDHMPEQWKTDARTSEAHLVRPSPEGNAICTCITPEIAAWLAERLNKISALQAEVGRLKAQAVTVKPDLDTVMRAMWAVSCVDTTYEEAMKAAQRGASMDVSAVLFLQDLAKAALSAITARTEDAVWNEAIEAAANQIQNIVNEAERENTQRPSSIDLMVLRMMESIVSAIRALARQTKGEMK